MPLNNVDTTVIGHKCLYSSGIVSFFGIYNASFLFFCNINNLVFLLTTGRLFDTGRGEADTGRVAQIRGVGFA